MVKISLSLRLHNDFSEEKKNISVPNNGKFIYLVDGKVGSWWEIKHYC